MQPAAQPSGDIGLQLALLCAAQRQAFLREGPPDYTKRLENLNKLLNLTLANEERIADAISQDFGHRSPSRSVGLVATDYGTGVGPEVTHRLLQLLDPSYRPLQGGVE